MVSCSFFCKREWFRKRGSNLDKKKTKQAVFIRPKTAWKKLVTAQKVAQTIYICGVTGYGKTELVKNYLKTREYTYYTCRNGRLQ